MPTWMSRVTARLRALASRGRHDREIDDELRLHLELLEEEYRGRGLSAAAAREQARRDFGNATLIRETSREQFSFRLVEQLRQDLRYGVRTLFADRTFSIATIGTLAVALALVTVVFAIFNAYVLRPYAVRDPYSLHELRWQSQDAGGRTFRWRDYQELLTRTDLFETVIAERNREVTRGNQPVLAAFVSGNYFDDLGARVSLGRGLAEFDARSPGDAPVAVLSDDAWRRLFDRDPAVLGRELRLNDRVFSVIGVAHRQFTGLNDSPPDVWVPVTMHAAVMTLDLFRGEQPRELALIARLQPHVTPAQAEEALGEFMTRVMERNGPVRPQVLLHATPAPLTLELMLVLAPIFGAFGLVLVAACANVSNLMLARGQARYRDIAVRLSLGASRGRVVRQMLTEGLLLAVVAGLAAIGLASLILELGLTVLFQTLPPSSAAMTRVVPLDLDHRVFGFTFLIAALTTVMFALLPSLQATNLSLTQALRGEMRSGRRGSRLRSILVAGQVAVSLMLLIGAVTFARNSALAAGAPLGIETDGAVSVQRRIVPRSAIPGAVDALANDPAVASVAVVSSMPLGEQVPRTPMQASGSDRITGVSLLHVSPPYFDLLGVSVPRGRQFNEDEGRAEAPVGVVSAAGAAALWPGEDPLGKTVRVFTAPVQRPDLTMARRSLVSGTDIAREGVDVTIVGVAEDVVSGMIYEGQTPLLYMPTSAIGSKASSILARMRAAGDTTPEQLQKLFTRAQISPISFEAYPLNEALALQLYPLRVSSWISMVLSSIALTLSVSGIFGVVAYALSRRTREIGIRTALGATPGAVVRLVMRQSSRLVIAGSLAGFLISFTVLAALRAMVTLPGLRLLDPVAFIGSVAIVAAAAIAATFVPARRAGRVDPVRALRAEG